jgi:histidyl-tRNA synthetase
MISVHPPSGFRDFLNQDASRRLFLMNQISSVYQSFGFLPLETPVVENLDLLLGGGGGEENEKLIFKVLKRGDKLAEALPSGDENRIAEFGLRFDLTLPLSRVVALHRGKIQMPWKVFHIGPVWRAERAQKGRYREFIQCDVDIIGAKGIGAEVEVIQAAAFALQSVGASGFELRINDRRLIQAMAEKFGFTGSKVEQFAVILDKKDKLELPILVEQLSAALGHALPSDLESVLEGRLSLEHAAEFHAVAGNELLSLVSTLRSLNLPLTQIVFDPSLVRGMGYYTGPVFELRHSSAGYSFGGGGRYDRLIGRWSGQEIPACGISIGFERLVLLLAELEKESQADSPVLFFPVFEEQFRGWVCSLASDLRRLGVCVDVFPDSAKIKNQFRFASDRGYRWVLIAGESEWASGVFKLKDFKSGSEVEVPAAELRDQVLKVFSQSKKS